MRRLVLLAVMGVVFLLACRGATRSPSQSDRIDALGANAACYVCHMTFVKEQLSKTHLAAKVACIKCHGLSAGHANDEDIGATPPDRVFDRAEIDGFCGDCHKIHDVHPAKVVAQWLKRNQERGIATPPAGEAVCTDCHGNHTIEGL